MELKSFNSINKLVKHEYYAQQSSSETSSAPNSQFNSLKKLKKEESLPQRTYENTENVKQEFSQDYQQMKMLEQIYLPDSFSATHLTRENTMATMGEAESRRTPFSGDNTLGFSAEELPIFGLKKEEENLKKRQQHQQHQQSQFVPKDFSLIESSSANLHHPYFNNTYNHQINHHSIHQENDENVNFSNFSDRFFFESPFQKKKPKFNTSIISPVDPDHKSSNPK